MKPYVCELRHDVFERRKLRPLRTGLKRQITIPKKLSAYILNENMTIGIWINKKQKLEIALTPVDFKKVNGIVLIRRILTNGHSYSFVIPPSAYDVLANIYDTYPIKKMNILVNSQKNLELTPIRSVSKEDTSRTITNQKYRTE